MLEKVSFLGAFTAGFLSFLAPCVLPLIPAYLSWLIGISSTNPEKKRISWPVFSHGLFLVLGFSIFFVLLGLGLGWLNSILSAHRLIVQRIGGILLIVFALELMGFLKFLKAYRVRLIQRFFSKLKHQSASLLIGIVFAFAWLACFSPILGSILVLAAFQENLSEGLWLLVFYALGLALPFLLSFLFLGLAMERIRRFDRIIKGINLLAGLVLFVLGLLLLTDNFYQLVVWLNRILS